MQTSTIIIIGILGILVIAYIWLIRVTDKANVTDWGNKFANRIDGLNRLFIHRYHNLQPTTIDLPEKGPAIVVANHISGLDALMLIASARRPLHFLIVEKESQRLSSGVAGMGGFLAMMLLQNVLVF